MTTTVNYAQTHHVNQLTDLPGSNQVMYEGKGAVPATIYISNRDSVEGMLLNYKIYLCLLYTTNEHACY